MVLEIVMTFDEYNEWLFKAANQFVALEDSITFKSSRIDPAGNDAWNAFQILKDMVNKMEDVSVEPTEIKLLEAEIQILEEVIDMLYPSKEDPELREAVTSKMAEIVDLREDSAND